MVERSRCLICNGKISDGGRLLCNDCISMWRESSYRPLHVWKATLKDGEIITYDADVEIDTIYYSEEDNKFVARDYENNILNEEEYHPKFLSWEAIVPAETRKRAEELALEFLYGDVVSMFEDDDIDNWKDSIKLEYVGAARMGRLVDARNCFIV